MIREYNAVIESIKYHVEEYGHDSSILINEDFENKIIISKNKYDIYSNLDMGLGVFDLDNGNNSFNIIYIIDLKDGINNFEYRENILLDLSNKIQNEINDAVKDYLNSSKEVFYEKFDEIKKLSHILKNLEFKLVILTNSVKKSLVAKDIFGYENSQLNLQKFENELKGKIKQTLDREIDGLVKYIESFNKPINNDLFDLHPDKPFDISKSEEKEDVKKGISKKFSIKKNSIILKFDFYTLKDKSTENRIDILSRTFVTMAKKMIDPDINGTVYSAKLFDLIELYDFKGKELFLKNIRLGIEDIMGVDTAISNTLLKNPKEFWYLNNGITMLISKGSLINNYNDHIKINNKNKDISDDQILDATIINGAQTISSATKYFIRHELVEAIYNFAKSINNYLSDEDLEGYKKALDDSNTYFEIAKNEAFVMLKVLEIETEKNEANLIDEKINSITVSLNRQKPVLPVDLAYTLPVINEINTLDQDFKENDDLKSYTFSIVRRGDASSVNNKRYTLNVLPRILYMIFNNTPGKAMSIGIKKLLEVNKTNDHFIEENLFPTQRDSIDEKEEFTVDEVTFKKYYKFVNFAMKLFEKLDTLQRLYKPKIESKEVVSKYKKFNSYSRYLMMYIIIRSYYEKDIDEANFSDSLITKDFTKWKLKSEDINTVLDEKMYANIIEMSIEHWEETLKGLKVESDDIFQINSFKRDENVIRFYENSFNDIKKILFNDLEQENK